MRMSLTARLYLVATMLVAVTTNSVWADSDRDKSRRERHSNSEVHQDEILAAAKRGDIRPLEEIAAAANREMPGQVVGVKAKLRGAKLVYEFKIVTGNGRVREVYVDAATLAIVKVE